MEQESRIGDELSSSLLTAERLRSSVEEAKSFKTECGEVGKQADRLAQMLRTLVRLVAGSQQQVYDRPIRRVVADVRKNLDRALSLVRKCRRDNVLRRVCTIINAADFRRVVGFLESSNGDVKWLLSVFDGDGGDGGGGGGIVISLPPIATNDPILPWVWSLVASVQMGKVVDKIEAANQLGSLAGDNDRNKKIIVDEGGVPPLLKLLKDGSSPEGQVSAASVLKVLSCDEDKVRCIVNDVGVPVIVQVLSDSPVRVQIKVATLVARMAEHDPVAQEEFARQSVIKPLVTLLSLDVFVDDLEPSSKQHSSIHSLVQMNKDPVSKAYKSFKSNVYSEIGGSGSGSGSGSRILKKERDNESPEVKHELKVSCAEALWMLARGNVANSRRITETKGLLSLAKIVEKEDGELRYNCLMTLMEITSAAESNADLRRAAFKTNSPAAKAVIDQMLWIIKEIDSPVLKIPAIQSIGSLARTFPARETRMIQPLVEKLGSSNQEVAMTAVISLQKFVCPENFLCAEHSKNIIEYGAVPLLMKLIRNFEQQVQLQCLVLLCYLSMNASNHEQLEQAKVLTVLEGAERLASLQNPELRELVSKAIYQLSLYNAGSHSQMLSYAGP